MKLSEHKNLKEAILFLPAKEKDKLLLRLVAKDKVLTEHLHFKLLEQEEDLLERTENLSEEIDGEIAALNLRKSNSKEILARMRKINSRINHHYKVTKDLFSETELRAYLLNKIPFPANEGLFSPYYKFKERLAVYFVKTALSLHKKYLKLHEDLQYDLKDKVNALLSKIYQSNMAGPAAELGLPKKII